MRLRIPLASMAKGVLTSLYTTPGQLRTVLSALFAGYDGKAAELGNRQSRRRPHGVTPGRLSYALDCPALRRDIVRIVSTLHDG